MHLEILKILQENPTDAALQKANFQYFHVFRVTPFSLGTCFILAKDSVIAVPIERVYDGVAVYDAGEAKILTSLKQMTSCIKSLEEEIASLEKAKKAIYMHLSVWEENKAS